jgi:hypothetical protein
MQVAIRRGHGLEVQIRVGLHSGEVVVRAIGNDLHMDYSAIGQNTHLAARMEQLAPPGSIRLTADTLRLAEGLVRVTALGPVPVKGLTAPVEVFELVEASALRRRLQAAAARGLTLDEALQDSLPALLALLDVLPDDSPFLTLDPPQLPPAHACRPQTPAAARESGAAAAARL